MRAREIDLHLPADVSSVRAARHAIREQLVGNVDEATQLDAELLVSELVTNGVQHGPGGRSWIDVHFRLDDGGITVEVEDQGTGFIPENVPDPDPSTPGGWGLTLVQAIADAWGTRQRGGVGTAVWFRLNRILAPS